MMMSMKWEKILKNESSSSMDEVRHLALNSAQEGTVVRVSRQLSGRGRRGREWTSPDGGLYFSVLLIPDWPLEDISKMTLMIAVAVCEGLQEFSDIQAQIKWPNDLLINGKKIAGILMESEIKGKSLEHMIAGVGININTEKNMLPSEAVSLREIVDKEYDLQGLLDMILARIEYWYEDIAKDGFDQMLNRWRELAGILGQEVQAESAQGLIKGIAMDISKNGGLLIKKDNGEMVEVISGEIVQIRMS